VGPPPVPDPLDAQGPSTQRRYQPWPPPAPIAPQAKVAALTTTIALVVAGAAYSFAAIRAAMCVGLCIVNRGFAGLIMLAVVPATLAAVAGVRSVSRRPVGPAGDSGWRFGLGAIFALGVWAAASRIPDLTCPHGYELGGELCARVGVGARLAASRWIWLKDALIGVGVIIGATVIAARRLTRYTWPVAALVWLVGSGLLLATTLLRA
jgi:hypothetical protein